MSTHADLKILIEKTAKSDRDAFRALYIATSPKLFGVAMRILRDPQKAGDALQDAYLQVWQRAATYQAGKGAVEAWMVSIVRFRAIDIVRRERAQTVLIDDTSFEEFFSGGSEHGDADDPDEMLSLRRCLERIGVDQRRALLDIHFHGFTGNELADRYDVPLGTIKSRVRRGLQNLRQCLEYDA